jgi:alanyl aminopeptidase
MRELYRAFFLFLAAQALIAAPPAFVLPDAVVPRKHTLELTIDPSQPNFEGRMTIEFDLKSATDSIWLNAKGLNVRETSLRIADRPISARLLTAGGEFLGLELPNPAGPGRGALSVRYQGRLDDKATVGLFRRKTAGDWYAYTTFTPIEARRAFPCFDEPRFKTPWEVSIRVRHGHSAFANGREASVTEEPGGWKLVRFAPTEPIPAEVVAFAVGPFDVLDGGKAGTGTPIRVITTKGRSAEGLAAVQGSEMILPRLEAYTGIPYPFGKLDHLAIPDSEFGAVENPGLIVYRAKLLLFAPDTETARAQPLRSLQAHEMGHQWFGNLVTQADWRDVWLSEGFATWISAKMMDMEQPAERVHLSAIVTRERIMSADISPRTRPVRQPVETRDAAGEIYNRFVYDKAAAVLMMLESWLGEDKFRDGLRAYLNAYRFANANADNLREALRQSSATDPGPVMRAFLDTGGTPVIRGEVECRLAGIAPASAEVRITQTGSAAVPVCWRTDSGASGCEVVETETRTVKLPVCPGWTYFNAKGTGYYRTTWTAADLSSLRLNELTPAERLTLVYDLRAQKNDRSAAREILQRLSADAQPEIVRAAREGLR